MNPHASTPNFWKRLTGFLATIGIGAVCLLAARFWLDADLIAGGGLSADTRSVSAAAFALLFGGMMFLPFGIAMIPTEFFHVRDAKPYRRLQATALYGGFALFIVGPWIATFAVERVLERHGYVECPVMKEVVGRFFKSHWAKDLSLCEHFER